MNQLKASHFNEQKCNEIVSRNLGKPGDLLTVLEEVQKITPHSYLPESTLQYIAEKMDVPLSRIYSVVTFYSFFNLKPQGDHTIVVCRGTACHTRGSRSLLEDLKIQLDIRDMEDEGEVSYTTSDNKFTVRTVACFGQCALAPVIAIDGVIHSNMTSEKLSVLLKKMTSKKTKKKGEK